VSVGSIVGDLTVETESVVFSFSEHISSNELNKGIKRSFFINDKMFYVKKLPPGDSVMSVACQIIMTFIVFI
jgi:hypothetical protein